MEWPKSSWKDSLWEKKTPANCFIILWECSQLNRDLNREGSGECIACRYPELFWTTAKWPIQSLSTETKRWSIFILIGPCLVRITQYSSIIDRLYLTKFINLFLSKKSTRSSANCRQLISLPIFLWRCPWCNGYSRRKWTRRHEFKSWTILIAFHIALKPLGKLWIQVFSLQLWINSRTGCVLPPWWGN